MPLLYIICMLHLHSVQFIVYTVQYITYVSILVSFTLYVPVCAFMILITFKAELEIQYEIMIFNILPRNFLVL